MNDYRVLPSAVSPAFPVTGRWLEQGRLQAVVTSSKSLRLRRRILIVVRPGGEEVRVRKERQSPTLPTASELAKHKLSHLPHRMVVR